MEHKLDELQQQGSRLGPSNLSKHDQVTELEHEVLQLTAENEVSHTVMSGNTSLTHTLASFFRTTRLYTLKGLPILYMLSKYE